MVTQVTKFRTNSGKEFDNEADANRAELDEVFSTELERAMKMEDIMAGRDVEASGLISAIIGGHPELRNPVRDVLVGYLNNTGATVSVLDKNRMLDDALSIIIAGINWIDVIKDSQDRGLGVLENTLTKAKENMATLYNDFTNKWCPKKD